MDCGCGIKRVKSLFCAQQQSPAVLGAGPAPRAASRALQQQRGCAGLGLGAFPALPPAALPVTLLRSLQSASTSFSFCFDWTVNQRGEDLCVPGTPCPRVPCRAQQCSPGSGQCHRPAARHWGDTDSACTQAAKHWSICHAVRSG